MDKYRYDAMQVLRFRRRVCTLWVLSSMPVDGLASFHAERRPPPFIHQEWGDGVRLRVMAHGGVHCLVGVEVHKALKARGRWAWTRSPLPAGQDEGKRCNHAPSLCPMCDGPLTIPHLARDCPHPRATATRTLVLEECRDCQWLFKLEWGSTGEATRFRVTDARVANQCTYTKFKKAKRPGRRRGRPWSPLLPRTTPPPPPASQGRDSLSLHGAVIILASTSLTDRGEGVVPLAGTCQCGRWGHGGGSLASAVAIARPPRDAVVLSPPESTENSPVGDALAVAPAPVPLAAPQHSRTHFPWSIGVCRVVCGLGCLSLTRSVPGPVMPSGEVSWEPEVRLEGFCGVGPGHWHRGYSREGPSPSPSPNQRDRDRDRDVYGRVSSIRTRSRLSRTPLALALAGSAAAAGSESLQRLGLPVPGIIMMTRIM
jgi:hypothetical protein